MTNYICLCNTVRQYKDLFFKYFHSSSFHFHFIHSCCCFCKYKCSWHWPSSACGAVENNKVMLFPERAEPLCRKKLHHCLFEDVVPGKAVLIGWEICFRVSKWIDTNWVPLHLQTFGPSASLTDNWILIFTNAPLSSHEHLCACTNQTLTMNKAREYRTLKHGFSLLYKGICSSHAQN